MPYPMLGPAFVVSTRTSPLLRLPDFLRIIADAQLDGVDVDLSRWTGRALLGLGAGNQGGLSQSVASLWIRSSSVTERGCRDTWVRTLIGPPDRPCTIVIAQGGPGERPEHRSEQINAANTLRRCLDTGVRIALAVQPRNPDGGRAHLARLQSLRHLVAEWDLDLALDLLGPVDPRWEAEAAVLRMLPRLATIRIPIASAIADDVRVRLTQRVLATTTDMGFNGTISLTPTLPFWRLTNGDHVARICAGAVARIRDRIDAVERDAALGSPPTITREPEERRRAGW